MQRRSSHQQPRKTDSSYGKMTQSTQQYSTIDPYNMNQTQSIVSGIPKMFVMPLDDIASHDSQEIDSILDGKSSNMSINANRTRMGPMTSLFDRKRRSQGEMENIKKRKT